ncbi:MAG: type II toxin-antitoxin system RelE/ParE family toxin [Lachnospiraceae bacterium]|nr:type II toxin-antitoxin system RelE/ParE family toxin [Lachnospiraceae bacterium]
MYEVVIPPSVREQILEYGKYIEYRFGFPEMADDVVDRIFKVIYSLEKNPQRGSHRRAGKYADTEFRQIFAGNYIIVYKVDEPERRVHIDAVRHMLESF